jgi:hypothetical protein
MQKLLAVLCILGFAHALVQPKNSLVEESSAEKTVEGSETESMSQMLAAQASEDKKLESEDKLEEVTYELKEEHLPQFQFAQAADLHAAASKCPRTVELLENNGNGASYQGKMFINGQKLDTIWDTGSDEAVVNSISTLNLLTPCFDAFGQAQHDCYNKLKSSSYRSLRAFPEAISYGSGDTFVLPGTDHVSLIDNQCLQPGVKFMELVQTDIPQLLGHEIDAIGGLGPKKFEPITFSSQMGVDRFSFCFMSNTSQPGQVIWNDYSPEENPAGFKFTTLPVKGKDYWAVKASDFTLSAPGKDSKKVGCVEKECHCVVDTGTSLITLDKDTLNEVETILNDFEKNTGMKCNEDNIKEFPTIKFYLEGKEHHFRPEDYLMYTEVNELPEHVTKALHFTAKVFPWLKEPESKKECVMMFTPPMNDGLCILGMPFFRNYMVTMDREARTISTAPHDGECRPAKSSFMQTQRSAQMKTIDASKFRLSKAYLQLSGYEGPLAHVFTHVI